MSAIRKRTLIGAVVGALALAPVLPATSVSAAPAKVFTVKATVKGASGKTLVLMSKSGRILSSTKLTSASKAVTMKTPKVGSLSGASLHLIGAGGDYYGPVVLGWTGSKSASATKVSTTMGSAATTVSLGTVNVKSVTTNQGLGTVASKYSKATSPTTKAVKGVPTGVGTYGKKAATGASARGVRAMAATYTQNNVAPGADADADGIANAFDVNDDGDAKLDFQDTDNKPQPNVSGDDCAAKAEFRVFSNFKATQPDFSGTINYYGTGDYLASSDKIAEALSNTLSFAMQRISGVICGETIIKNEFKGINVPYAPTDWVEMPAGGMDVQWAVGAGRMNNSPVTGLSAYTFTCPASKCEISGQDTFVQRVTTASGKTFELVTTPGFVFVTHPMLTEINGTAVDYSANPIVGSQNGSVAVADDATLTIKVYRPQRLAIEGESGTVLDIAGLEYYPDIPNAIDTDPSNPGNQGSGASAGRCDGAKVTDSTLMGDTPINTVTPPVFTITWEMSKIQQCFTTKGATWASGILDIDIQVVAPVQNSGNSAQKIYFSVTVS